MPRLPEDTFVTLSPDSVCQPLSPSIAAMDRITKLRIYDVKAHDTHGCVARRDVGGRRRFSLNASSHLVQLVEGIELNQ